MRPRRRRVLAIGAIVVLAGLVDFVVFREDPKDDVPRLAILRQEHTNGQRVVVFRLDALKHRRATLTKLSTQNLSTGEERPPMLLQGVGEILPGVHEEYTGQGTAFFLGHQLETRGGQSKEFWVIAPVDAVWRLQGSVAFEDRRIRSVLVRLKWSWQEKSLAPIRWPVWLSVKGFESEPITNAVPQRVENVTL